MLLRSRERRNGPRGAEQPGPNMYPPCASSPRAAGQCSHSVCHGSLNNQGAYTNKTKKPSVSPETSHKQRARPGPRMELDAVNHSTSCSLSNLGQTCTLASRHRPVLGFTCCTLAQGLPGSCFWLMVKSSGLKVGTCLCRGTAGTCCVGFIPIYYYVSFILG